MRSSLAVSSGNGGAPSDAAFIDADPGVVVHYANGTNYGFALATVTDSAMTINYHLYNAASDTWSVAGYQTVFVVPEPSTFALVVAGLMILAAPGIRARVRSAVDS